MSAMKSMLLLFSFFYFINGLFSSPQVREKSSHAYASCIFRDTVKNRLLDTVDVNSNYKTFIVDSLQQKNYTTAYDLLSHNPNFRFTDEGVYYQDKLLDIIKINGQVFKFRSPVELLKMFPSNILSSFSLSPYTDPLNSFWGNNNKNINSLDLRTPSGKIFGILGTGNLKYNFRKRFDLLGNTILFKNNKNFVVDFGLNNNAWGWGQDVDGNLNKIINGNFSIQNNTKLKNGELNLNFSFRKSQSITKDYFADNVVVIDDNDNKVYERIQKNSGQSFQFNSSLNKFYKKIYFDVLSNFQYSRNVGSMYNSDDLKEEFRSNDSVSSSSYNGSFNLGYKLYKDNLFIVAGTSFGRGQSDGQNQNWKNETDNFVINNSVNNFFQPKLALKFNIDKVFLGDIYYNFSNSLSSSTNLINNDNKTETFLKNRIEHTGAKLRYTKTKVDFNTDIYYEKSISEFENNTNKLYLDQNEGIFHNSSASIRLFQSKLMSSFSFSRSLVYPSIGQKDPANAVITDTYASIGNLDLKNQSLINFNWNASYQLKNSDNVNLSFSRSISRNKIVENLHVLPNDTTIAGIHLVKGVRLLTYSNSMDNRSPNTAISFLYSRSKFLIDNLSLQNTLSYSTNKTERIIDSKNFTDNSKGYRGNLSMNYLKGGFGVNTNYNFSLNRNKFDRVGMNDEENNIQTINHNLMTSLRVNYFVLFNIELSNSYDAVRYSSNVYENSRTDLIISQKYLKGKLEFKFSIFDLFNQMKQNNVVKNDFLITRKASTNLIGRYFMLNLTYRFQNLKS